MKKLVLLFLFIVTSCMAQDQKRPKIHLEEDKYDFGDIKEGVVVSHDFIIENSGEKKLKIFRVKASCGCTAVSPSKKQLEPGEKTSVQVQFNSAHRHGTQRKHVYIFTNDPETPQYRISFSAYVMTKKEAETMNTDSPRMRLLDKRYNFGIVEKDSKAEWIGEIKNVGKEVLKINDAKASADWINIELTDKEINPNEVGTFKLTLDSSGREGSLTRTVEFFTNDPYESKQVLTVFVYIPRSEK